MFDQTNDDFASPSMLPGVPQAGGYFPSTSEALYEEQARQANLRMSRAVLENDTRARYLSDMAMRGLAGDRAQVLAAGDGGRAFRQAAGAMVNSQAMAPLMGGSSIDMLQGLQAVAGSRGRMMMAGAGPSGMATGGRGMNTDMVAMGLFDQVQRELFDPTTGGQRMGMTHGADRSEVGGVLFEMSRRGSFSGMQKGSLQRVTNENFKELGRTEADVGQLAVTVNPAMKEKVVSNVEAGTRALAQIKDLMGPGKPMSQYFKALEDLSGLSMNGPGSATAAAQAVSRIKQTASAYDVNPQALAANVAGMARTISPITGPAAAAQIALESQQRGLYLAEDRKNQSGYTARGKNAQEVAAMQAMDVTTIIDQETELRGVAGAIDKMTTLTDDQRAEMDSMMTAFGNAKSPAERDAIRSQMRQYTRQNLGMSTSDLAKAFSMETLSADAQTRVKNAATGSLDQRINSNMKDAFDRYVANPLGKAGLDKGEVNSVRGMFEEFTDQDITDINAMVRDPKKSDADLQALINERASGSPEEKKAMFEGIQGMIGKHGRDGFTNAVDLAHNVVKANDKLANRNPRGARSQHAERMLAEKTKSRVAGTGQAASRDIMKNVIAGFMGGSDVTDEDALAYAAGYNTQHKDSMGGTAQLELDDKGFITGGVERLRSLFGDEFMKGVNADTLKTAEGQNALLEKIERAGGAYGSVTGKDGKRMMAVGNKEGTSAIKKHLESMSSGFNWSIMTGKDLTDVDFKNLPTGTNIHDYVAQARGNMGNVLTAAMEQGGNGQMARSALKSYAGADRQGLLEGLNAKEAELKAKLAEAQGKWDIPGMGKQGFVDKAQAQLSQFNQMREEVLKQVNGGGGDVFRGILELTGGPGVTIRVEKA